MAGLKIDSEIIDTLVRASNTLHKALDEYLHACSTYPEVFHHEKRVKYLPDELANRIKAEAQLLLNYEAKLQEAKYPERLSHVCIRWRQVTFSSRKLWVHIDLSPYRLLNDGLVPRAEAYAERSGQLPLYLHVHGPTNSRFGTPDDPCPIDFIASVAAHTRSLDLDIHYEYADFHSKVLETCLKDCVPGVHTRLIVREAEGNGSYHSKLIRAKGGKPTEDESHVKPLLLDLPKQNLEDILLRSVTLHLDGLHLVSSYHGLTSYISKTQLRDILKPCPQLCILEFGLGINNKSDAGSVKPIRLNKLSTLALDRDLENWEAFLRLIAPGSNPLHLSIAWDSETYDEEIESYAMVDEFTDFFTHSKITKVTLTGSDTCFRAFDILKYAINVQELALDEVYWQKSFEGGVPDLDVNVDT
ncbi:hypothetical protein FRC11_013330, partial [Ceratobasidium sp. 423]